LGKYNVRNTRLQSLATPSEARAAITTDSLRARAIRTLAPERSSGEDRV